MKIENNKIIEATENELFSLYLKSNWSDFIDFYEYMRRMEKTGVKITDKEKKSNGKN